jgi:hypothetical protein
MEIKLRRLFIMKGIINNFLDDYGKVKIWPVKRKNKCLALDYIASKFEYDVNYTEKEINTIINENHLFNDCATIRRELFDMGYINRTRDGIKYWRIKTNNESECNDFNDN